VILVLLIHTLALTEMEKVVVLVVLKLWKAVQALTHTPGRKLRRLQLIQNNLQLQHQDQQRWR
jgi:hypothetical protein